MKNLEGLRDERHRIQRDFEDLLAKNEGELIDKIINDMRDLLELDFNVIDGYQDYVRLRATDKKTNEFIYIEIDTETLKITDIDDQTPNQKYIEVIEWYFEIDGVLPPFTIQLIKNRTDLENKNLGLELTIKDLEEENKALKKDIKELEDNYDELKKECTHSTRDIYY